MPPPRPPSPPPPCAMAQTPVAYTYNDPVIFAEYAIDTALACRGKRHPQRGGHRRLHPPGTGPGILRRHGCRQRGPQGLHRRLLSTSCAAAICSRFSTPLAYIHHETDCWLEITTLLVPGHNDEPGEIAELSAWIYRELGPDVPPPFHRLPPGLEDDRSAAHGPGQPDPGSPDRPGGRSAPRIHR